jgi:hypothetical protein
MVLAALALSTRTIRALSIIRSGVSKGLPSAHINTLITNRFGVGLRRTSLLEGIRHIKNIRESATHSRNIRRDYRPDPNRIPIAKTPIRSNFSYLVELRPLGWKKGDGTERGLTVISSENLSIQEIELKTVEALQDEQKMYGDLAVPDVGDILVVEAKRRAP